MTAETPRVVRRAGVIRLRPEKEQEYRELHAAVWPGVAQRLRDSHFTNFSIFLRDGLLFSYYEYTGTDFDADNAAIAADAETQRWWSLTDPCQQPVESAAPGEWWAPMDEVCHLP